MAVKAWTVAVGLVLLVSQVIADVIHVDVDAAPGGNGSSWATAYQTLQDALLVAQSGDDIWVADGTYYPDVGGSETVGDRHATFQLITGVGIYGGFTGSELLLQDRDPTSMQTVLSGSSADSYHVTTGNDVDPTAILDGFVITGGRACCGATSSYDWGGGGMINYVTAGSPTVLNCTFIDNSAEKWGGAVYSRGTTGNPTFVNCRFIDNSSHVAGAMESSLGHVVLINCEFIGNQSSHDASAVKHYTGGLELVNCTFASNVAADAGTLMADVDEPGDFCIVSNCVFWDNVSLAGGSLQKQQIWWAPTSIEYSCVEGWDGTYGGVGNHGLDPLFLDVAGADGIPGTSDDDLRPSPGSPNIDAGDSTAFTWSESVDVDLTPRFLDDPNTNDTGVGPAPVIDIGSQEYRDLYVSDLTPASGLFHQTTPVTLTGSGFDQVLPMTVTFGASTATGVTWISSTEVTCVAPVGTQGETVDLTLEQDGVATVLSNAFTYEGTTITSFTPTAGNVTGGTAVSLGVDHATTVGDTTATVGGQATSVESIGADGLTVITTPAVSEPTGVPVAVEISNSNGTGVAPSGFLYTPALFVDVNGSTTTGGAVEISWITDPSASGQLVWLWMDNPATPDLNATLLSMAGVLHADVLIMILTAFPAGINPLSIAFGPLDPIVAGFPFHLQGGVTGEGGSKGSFTNVAELVIP